MMETEVTEKPRDELGDQHSPSLTAQHSTPSATAQHSTPSAAAGRPKTPSGPDGPFTPKLDQEERVQEHAHPDGDGDGSNHAILQVPVPLQASRPRQSREPDLSRLRQREVMKMGSPDTQNLNSGKRSQEEEEETSSFSQGGPNTDRGYLTTANKDGGGDASPAEHGNGAVVGNERKEKEGDGEDAEKGHLRRRLKWSMLSVLVLYLTALLSVEPVVSQYLFRRIAQDHFNLTDVKKQTPCASAQNDSLQEALNWVQSHTSRQLLYFNFSEFIPAIFVALIIGSCADYFGRKLLVLMPVVGSLLKSVVTLLVVYLDLDIRYLYLGHSLEGLFGSFYVVSLGVFAAVADVTVTSRQRVLLFATLEITLGVAGAVSMIGSGFLIKALGFEVPCLLVSCLFLISVVNVVCFMPETLRNRPDRLTLNPLVHMRKVFGFYFTDGPRSQRALYLIGQFILFFAIMVNLGRMQVETLFVINSPLCWGSVKIGLFMGIRILLQNLSSLLVLKVLSRWMRIELVGLLGLLSGVAGFSLQAVATTDLLMVISGCVGLLIMTVSPVVRTLMSRMTPADKQGALFASLSAMETICHLSASTLYNTVYSATLNVFPGAVFLLIAALLTFDVGLLILFTLLSRKFPQFQEVQIEVKIPEPDVSPDLKSSFSSTSVDETTPLCSTQPVLKHRRN